jgi:hypothetical protein
MKAVWDSVGSIVQEIVKVSVEQGVLWQGGSMIRAVGLVDNSVSCVC